MKSKEKTIKLEPREDPNNPGNGPEYHTGKECIEEGCYNPAGTYWSPWWCFEHNKERMRRITENLEKIIEQLNRKKK